VHSLYQIINTNDNLTSKKWLWVYDS